MMQIPVRKKLLWLFLSILCAAGVIFARGEETETSKEGASSCTVCIYMCGSNLESNYGLAGENITELLKAEIPENVNVVLETGGAWKWNYPGIASDHLQRYVIRNHELILEQELKNASMGEAETFQDFLKWGTERYPADRRILVMWDHGGNSGQGICCDENYGNDYLDRSELVSALQGADLSSKLEMILFDACYMGCIETAMLMQDYADYMLASQTVIPGSGIDYQVFVSSLSTQKKEGLGKLLCDSFLEKCRQNREDPQVQLSLYDLGKTDQVIEEINDACLSLLAREKSLYGDYKIRHAAETASVGNPSGSANLIDVLEFMKEAIRLDVRDHYDKTKTAVESLIPYQVAEGDLPFGGVSIYYPITYNEKLLADYTKSLTGWRYGRLLESIFSDIPKNAVEFQKRGKITDGGQMQVSLTKESRYYLRSITYRLWREDRTQPDSYLYIGEDCLRSYGSQLERLLTGVTFTSNFQGEWYCLEEKPLLTSVNGMAHTAAYSAPVNINGVDTVYTFFRITRGSRSILLPGPIGNGLDEYGFPERETRYLEEGDKIKTYLAVDETGEERMLLKESTVSSFGGDISLYSLGDGRYRYQFIATDILGRETSSDYGIFQVTRKDGKKTVKAVEVIEKETYGS